MANYQITTFLIGILLAGAVVSGLGLALASFSSEYSLSYDNSSLDAYNQMSDINELSEELKDQSNDIQETSATDVIGGYITQGYNALKITLKSTTLFSSMANSAAEDANLGGMSSVINTLIIASVAIIVILGIIISAIMKWSL